MQVTRFYDAFENIHTISLINSKLVIMNDVNPSLYEYEMIDLEF